MEEKDWATKFKTIKIESLKMYHKECNGGEIAASEIPKARLGDWENETGGYLALCCIRCKKRIWLDANEPAKEEIIRTAIDGKERKINVTGYEGNIFPGYNPWRLQKEIKGRVLNFSFEEPYVEQPNTESRLNVYVVQKDSEDFYCPFCGSQLVTTATYCHNCGAELEDRIKEIEKVSTPSK
ncbi:MAG: zinc-ribbon domain-containing protein [Candidatus Nealsonbacteria bacterium]